MSWKRAATASALVVLQITSAAAFAYDLGISREGAPLPGQTAEYIFRNDSDEALIPIYLLGAVSRPGLYHIPANMDLVGLLTVAGGVSPGAQIDRIVVKGQGANASKPEVRFNLDKAIQGETSTRMSLASSDLVYVTPGKPPITGEILTALGIATGVLGIVATSLLISQAAKNK